MNHLCYVLLTGVLEHSRADLDAILAPRLKAKIVNYFTEPNRHILV